MWGSRRRTRDETAKAICEVCPVLDRCRAHALAVRDLEAGFGSVFTFTLRGDADTAQRFVEALDVFTHMTHLGDVRSLVLHPASTSLAFLTEAERRAVGVEPGTLRVSIGIEDVADLVGDLGAALEVAVDVPVAVVA